MINKNLNVNVNITDTEFFKKLAGHLSRLVDQIETSDFKDDNGHPLKNNAAYIGLIDYIANFIEEETE